MPRRVLLVSLHHPELVRGGSQQICYELFAALKSTAVQPILLASAQVELTPAVFKPGAIITGFDGHEDEFLFLSAFYDSEWHRNREFRRLEVFETFLRDVAPDVIHFHHFLSYGLEYLAAARKYLNETGGQLVFTLHEFMAICRADGQMARTFDKSPCDRASPVRCHQCFPEKSPEFFSMRTMWFKHHFGMVDTFVATSNFTLERYVEWGLPREKIIHIPAGHNLGRPSATPRTAGGARTKRNRFAFFGQLIESKGLQVLFEAVRILRSEGIEDFGLDVFGANLEFASTGFREEFERFWREEEEHGEGGVPRSRLHPRYEMADLPRLMNDVDWVVVPSRWGETFMMVISEAFLFGKPVICSNIGVMAERVRDGETGLHFVVGSSRSLAEAMGRALAEDRLWDRLSANIEPPPSAAWSAQRHLELCYRDGRDAAGDATRRPGAAERTRTPAAD